MKKYIWVMLVFVFTFSGCTQDEINRNLYEGVKTSERMNTDKNMQSPDEIQRDVPYNEYKNDIEKSKF